MKTKTLLPFAVIALLAFSLAACGRRGPLEPPPNTPQGQALAKQRASQNAKRGLAPASGQQSATPEEEAEAAKVNDINLESDARQEDATPARLREDPLTPVGEAQMPFASGTNMVKPPQPSGSEQSALSPKGTGRKPPPIQRPNKSFVLDPLLD